MALYLGSNKKSKINIINGFEKGYAEGFAQGLAQGKAEGASDPAAEAVMVLLRSNPITEVTNVDIANGVFTMQIVEEGHYCCYKMIIPECVTYIAEEALSNYYSYVGNQIVLCLPTVPPIMGWQGAWSHNGGNFPPVAIYVPDESVDAYKTAENWSEFADLIKPMSELTNKGNNMASLAPGLYETGTSNMIESWDELVARGAIVDEDNDGIYQNDEIPSGDLVLSNDVTMINEYGFTGSEWLTGIGIPNSVTSIGDGAFYGCSNLTNVVYNGTVSQMNMIEKGQSVFTNTSVTNIICSDGNIDAGGWTN